MPGQNLSTLLALAKKLQHLGDFEGARKLLESWRLQHERPPAPSEALAIELEIGETYLLESRFIKAGQHFSRALEIAERANDVRGRLQSRFSIAKLLFHQKDFEKTTMVLGALADGEAGRAHKEILAHANGLLGEIHCIEGRFDQSKALHSISLKQFQELGDEHGMADQISNLGRAYLNLGDYGRARQHFLDARKRFESIGDRNQVAIQINNLGGMLSNLGYHHEGIKLLKEALQIRVEIGNYAGMANQQEGIAYIHQYCLKDYTEAIKWYKQTVASLEFVRNQIAGTHEQQASYFAELFEVYQELIELLCQEYLRGSAGVAIDEIFQYIERAKANVLLSRITQRTHFEASAPSPATEETARLAELEHEINQLDDAILILLKEDNSPKADKVLAERKQRQIEFAELKLAITLRESKLRELDRSNIVELQKLKEVFEPDEVFLSYYVTVAHAYCLEISRSVQALHCLGTQEILNTLIDKYRQALGEAAEGKNKNYFNTGHSLWSFLTKDGKLMQDISTHCLVSPDAKIGYIVFEGLPTGSDIKKPIYAGTKRCLIYQPSASLLANKRCEQSSNYEVEFVGFANSSFNSDKFAELPGAEEEMREIAKHFHGRGKPLNINLNATKDAFLEQTAKSILCIHVAAHAIANFENLPELKNLGLEEPAIILSLPSGRPADFLLASEIFSKNIRAKLVTLSACDSGSGGLIRGEGIGSLARAFLGAGAGCVVFSMWPVRDVFARDFMTEFYKEMATRSIGDALFAARQTMTKRYPDPMDWASFIVVGNARTKLLLKR